MNISLALGGGGAKGAAHLGVLLCLEKHSIAIKAIAGTSAGGIVAALYAAGFSPAEILDRLKITDQKALFGRQAGDWPSILGVAGINHLLLSMLGECTFADLKIPCTLTAVDLDEGREILLSKGRVVDAVLATIALPGVFPTQIWEGHHLVDGGMLDPVPVLPARALSPKLPVVAVVLNKLEPQPVNYLEPPAFLTSTMLLKRFARLRVAQAFNIFLHSLEISNRALTEMRLKIDCPDLIIQPDVEGIGILDRVNVTEIASRGERAAEIAMPELMKLGSWSGRIRRSLRFRS